MTHPVCRTRGTFLARTAGIAASHRVISPGQFAVQVTRSTGTSAVVAR